MTGPFWRAAILLVVALGVFSTSSAFADRSRQIVQRLDVIAFAELPSEARRTIRLIRADGPFPYERDGAVFGNFERLLPHRERGYYREYTVPTPGLSHRGARRIVVGRQGELYYTDDHYRTFRRIRE
jgi:ribonuclease T1